MVDEEALLFADDHGDHVACVEDASTPAKVAADEFALVHDTAPVVCVWCPWGRGGGEFDQAGTQRQRQSERERKRERERPCKPHPTSRRERDTRSMDFSSATPT